MVRSGAFQLEVLVAGVALAEHAAPSVDTYVETARVSGMAFARRSAARWR